MAIQGLHLIWHQASLALYVPRQPAFQARGELGRECGACKHSWGGLHRAAAEMLKDGQQTHDAWDSRKDEAEKTAANAVNTAMYSWPDLGTREVTGHTASLDTPSKMLGRCI